ncbi:hypothetical protein D3C76_1126930 [compost metagenome]
MIVGHRQCTVDRVLASFSQYQSRQGGAGSAGQPPAVVVAPAQTTQLLADLLLELHAAARARQTATALGHGMQIGILLFPWKPETWLVPSPITAITEPVQLHAERLQIVHRWRLLGMPTQQADRGETKPLARSCQRMEMIGMRTAQTDDAFGTGPLGCLQVFDELEPLVAADQRVDLIQAQDRHFDAGDGEPVEVEGFEGGLREPIARREIHRCRFWVKSQHSSRSQAAIASRLAPTGDL